MLSTLLVDQKRYPLDAASGRRYKDQFKNDFYIRFPSFFKPAAFQLLCMEARRLSDRAIRRDLKMAATGNTPRKMCTVGGDQITENSTVIPALYRDQALLSFLAGVAGEEVYEIPDPVENFGINILERTGDVHGGHVDTYAFAFNLLVETPPKGGGGALEFVPGSAALEDLDGPKACRIEHQLGDCYLLKADQAIHRVAPLTRPGRRMVISLGYANPATIDLRSYSSELLYSSS